MDVIWSPHARDLLGDILTTIALEQSPDDARRWRQKIDAAAEPLLMHPLIGRNVPANCFFEPPADLERLHQLICGPYRIVYEATSAACYILSVRHCRMMLRTTDTFWN